MKVGVTNESIYLLSVQSIHYKKMDGSKSIHLNLWMVNFGILVMIFFINFGQDYFLTNVVQNFFG